MYGPNTKAVQSIIDRMTVLTEDEVISLAAAWYAGYGEAYDEAGDVAWGAAWDAAWYAADGVARVPAWDAARYAAGFAARNATWDGARYAIRDAVWDGARDAIAATVSYDLATEDGPYTITQRDMLLAPWVSVCGLPS